MKLKMMVVLGVLALGLSATAGDRRVSTAPSTSPSPRMGKARAGASALDVHRSREVRKADLLRSERADRGAVRRVRVKTESEGNVIPVMDLLRMCDAYGEGVCCNWVWIPVPPYAVLVCETW